MTIDEYQKQAQRTSSGDHERVLNGVLGLAGESGECADLVKKCLFQGHVLDRDHMIEELGDVLWYCAELATGLDVSLEAVAHENLCKLRKRYPNGFEPERSINRND